MVVHAYYPLSETRVEREARALLQRGYQVDVICLRADGEGSRENVEGINVYRLPVKRHKRLGPVVQLLEYLSFYFFVSIQLIYLHLRRRYQVIQVHNLPDFLIFAALVPKLLRARLILDLHDLMPEFFSSTFSRSMQSWPVRLLIWQEQLACRFADHVVTVSEHWRQTLIERGVPAQRCSVVMNVADESVFHYSEFDPTPPPNDSRFRLIYHGTIVERYGLDLAVQAINQVRYDIPDIHLTILGKGDYVEALTQMVGDLDLGHHVTIHNEIRPAEELPQFIQTANLGIVPYRNDIFTDELLPTKLMEYAALGLPAIASRTTAIEAYFSDTMVELFRPGDSADLARCIRTLYESPERLAELARGCRKFNERYNWTKISAEYVALVERMSAEPHLYSARDDESYSALG